MKKKLLVLQFLGSKIEPILYTVFFIVIIISGYNRALYPGKIIWGDDLLWQSWIYRIGYGEVPFRDFHLLYGIILPYLFSLPFKLLGGDFLAWNLIRYLGLPVLSFLIAVLVARKVFKTAIFRIIFLVIASTFDAWGFFFLQPWNFRFWLGLFTIVILFSKLKHRFFLSGVWLGVVTFSSVDQGVYVFGSLAVLGLIKFVIDNLVFTKDSRLLVLEFGKGVGLVVILIFLFLLSRGTLKSFVEFSFVSGPSDQLTLTGLPFPDFPFDKLQSGFFTFIISKELRYYLPIFVYMISLTGLIFSIRKTKINWMIWFLTIYGILSFRSALGRSDFGHLVIGYMPAILLSIWFLERIYLNIHSFLRYGHFSILNISKINVAVAFLIGGLFFFFLIRSPFERGFLIIFSPGELNPGYNRGSLVYNSSLRVYLTRDQSENIEGAIRYLKEIAHNKYFAHELMGGMNFLTGSKNITRFDYDPWALIDEPKSIIKQLEYQNNLYVVRPVNNYLLKGSLLDDYFNQYYTFDKQFGEIIIAKRNSIPFNPAFVNNMGLIQAINNSWTKVGEGVYELSFQPMEINQIKIALKLFYRPLTRLFAKTQAKLEVYSLTDSQSVFESDTPFVPSYLSSGQLTFHLYKNILAHKLRLILSAPGGLNPAPVDTKIITAWFFK